MLVRLVNEIRNGGEEINYRSEIYQVVSTSRKKIKTVLHRIISVFLVIVLGSVTEQNITVSNFQGNIYRGTYDLIVFRDVDLDIRVVL